MANTIRAAKNTFLGGLVMDLAPDTTPNEVLTSALNATLVTFNGNEMQLQNDMGNGRVETARLPEGYIPVGTCEFGDIIYIVSYNPLTNRSQIGCFPSPERNISSEEIGSTGQILQASDFLEGTLSGSNFTPSGEIKTSSVKKIIYNNKLNPGDKFIIYDKNNKIIQVDDNTITDIGNDSHEYGAWPKLLRVHVIAIEDSGKINYLDSTLKWYESGHYFIQEIGSGIGGQKIDIDSYRSLLDSGYSVFQSKISGKLALLIEVEKINGFSCTYSIYGTNTSTSSGIKYKDYEVFWNISWDTEDPNINPMCIVLTKSKWVGKQVISSLEENNNKIGYRLWEIDTSPKGDVKLSNYHDDIAIPKSFPSSDYWYAYISPYSSSNQLLYGTTYQDFKSSKSYDSRLENALDTIRGQGNNALNDLVLTKLNVKLDSNSIPIPGTYYVNATKIMETDVPGDNNTLMVERKVYTLNTLTGEMSLLEARDIDDIIVNNYFHHSIYKDFSKFTIPVEQEYTKGNLTFTLIPDLSNLVYNYEVTPAMPYGLLREYSVEGFIDFGKIGTGAIDITAYKYFVGENAVTLTLGLDAYVEDNKGIDEICIEFYDNQGIAASYHIGNKDSYSGQFTEVIPLNGVTNTSKLRNTNYRGETQYHMGLPANSGDTNLVEFDPLGNGGLGGVKPAETYVQGTTCINDCGTLYSNMLYLAKIIIKYCPKDALGDLDTSLTGDFKVFYRWMYTTPIFNDYYFQVLDFDNIKLSLTLDIAADYQFTNNYYYKVFNYDSDHNGKLINDSSELYKYTSAKVQLITNTGNVTADSGVIVDPDNPDDPNNPDNPGGDTEPFRQYDPFTSIVVWQVSFNKTITEVNTAAMTFTLVKDGVTTVLTSDNYRVNAGIGSMVCVIEFINIGNTYLMYVNVPAGAIKCGSFENTAITMDYGFNNGARING